MKKVIVACVFILIVASEWAWTKAPSSSSFLPESFSAKFTQKYLSRLSKKEKSSDGEIDYLFPGNIKFEMKGKGGLTFVSNTEKTWHFSPPRMEGEPAELKVSRHSNQNLAHFFDVLKNGLQSNKNYVVSKHEGSYQIEFTPDTVKKINIVSAVLTFKANSTKFEDLKAIELLRERKKKVNIIFSEIKVDKKFNSNHFIFKSPTKNVRITEFED